MKLDVTFHKDENTHHFVGIVSVIWIVKSNTSCLHSQENINGIWGVHMYIICIRNWEIAKYRLEYSWVGTE